MKVSTARRRLAERFQDALESGSIDQMCRIADYAKALGVALADRQSDEDVDLSALSVNSESASHILGYHREHVRRLVRQALVQAEKEGNQLRIPITSIIATLEGRVPRWATPRAMGFLSLFGRPWAPPKPGPEVEP